MGETVKYFYHLCPLDIFLKSPNQLRNFHNKSSVHKLRVYVTFEDVASVCCRSRKLVNGASLASDITADKNRFCLAGGQILIKSKVMYDTILVLKIYSHVSTCRDCDCARIKRKILCNKVYSYTRTRGWSRHRCGGGIRNGWCRNWFRWWYPGSGLGPAR